MLVCKRMIKWIHRCVQCHNSRIGESQLEFKVLRKKSVKMKLMKKCCCCCCLCRCFCCCCCCCRCCWKVRMINDSWRWKSVNRGRYKMADAVKRKVLKGFWSFTSSHNLFVYSFYECTNPRLLFLCLSTTLSYGKTNNSARFELVSLK